MSTLAGRLREFPRWTTKPENWWAMVGGVSVRTKIFGIVLALTVVLGLGITWQVRVATRFTLINELEGRGRSVASDLATRSVDPILLNDTFALHELLVQTLANHPDAIYAFVVDAQGNILANTFDDGFPGALITLNYPDDDGSIHQKIYNSNAGVIHDFSAPIFDSRAGMVRIGMSENRLQTVINVLTTQLLLTTLLVAVGGIVAASLLTWLLTRPIVELVETTRRVGRGDLSVHAPHWADDEIGTLGDAFNQMVADLRASREAVIEKEAARTNLLAKLINAQEDERRRIARELHDGVGQSLTSIMVGLKILNQLPGTDAQAAKRAELRQIASESLVNVRLLSRQLRPSVLDDMGLSAALERYGSEFSNFYPHITVDVHSPELPRLHHTTETSLYRIIQEAMTNAARHSEAKTISVLLSQRGNRVQAIVEDDGHGFDPAVAHANRDSVGLHSMAERAELLGGTLKIESGGGGTSIYIEVPL